MMDIPELMLSAGWAVICLAVLRRQWYPTDKERMDDDAIEKERRENDQIWPW